MGGRCALGVVREVHGHRTGEGHGRHDHGKDGHRALCEGREVHGHRTGEVHDHRGHVRGDHCDHHVVRVGHDHHDHGNQNHRDCGCADVVHHDLGLGDFVHDALQDLASRDAGARQVRFRSRFHRPR